MMQALHRSMHWQMNCVNNRFYIEVLFYHYDKEVVHINDRMEKL